MEWLGPYIKQEIEVNRYLADLSNIKTVIYNFTGESNPVNIDMNKLKRELSVVRLWDWDAAFTKLKPEDRRHNPLQYRRQTRLHNPGLYFSSRRSDRSAPTSKPVICLTSLSVANLSLPKFLRAH
ncbi:MAG: hypothetical protein J7J65_01020 [Candidatus Korarchaeota archaeon]|nr:hypothetical protein [Candidatus Korarchaeota archaeon]